MKQKTREAVSGLSFVAVSLLGVLFFSVAPFFISIGYSFSAGAARFQFAGLANYLDLFRSEAFRQGLFNTIRFILIGVPLLMAVSMALALAFHHLDGRFQHLDLWFALSLLPMLIPSSVLVVFMKVFFDKTGIVNGWLAATDISPVNWFNSNWSMVLLLGLYLWKNFSYITVILLGALQGIPYNTIEAAQLDGASSARILWSIRLPQVLPFLQFSLLLCIMNIFKMYRESYLLFGDYPHKSVYMIQNFMNNNFQSVNYQRLSAASVLFFLLISVGIFFIARRRTQN